MNIPGKEMFAVAAESIGKIGPDYKLGDVVAAALKAGPPDVVDGILRGVIESAQRPWLVHGTRYQFPDNFDYENDCYRGDSVEIFFEADAELPRKVELVIDVFDDLRAQNMPLLAWISLRFMAPSESLIGMAAFSPVTCAIEVAMLRGGFGNDAPLDSGDRDEQRRPRPLGSTEQSHWARGGCVVRRAVSPLVSEPPGDRGRVADVQ